MFGDELWEKLNDVMNTVTSVGMDLCMTDCHFPERERPRLDEEIQKMEMRLLDETAKGPPTPDRRPALTELLITTEYRIREMCDQHHVNLNEIVQKHHH